MSIKELINKITEKSLVLRNPRMDNSNYDEALQFITSRELRELVRCCHSEYRKLKSLERQLEEAREIIAGMDIYIEAECHEAWANNYEIRESAFVDMAKKLKQLNEKGDE